MPRLTPALLILAIAATCAGPASAQPAAPAGTAGGVPVFDAANLVRLVIDVTLHRARQKILEAAGKRATSHYRRVTQYVGVDVFRSVAARDALTSRPPTLQFPRYAEVYRPGYAAGVPEAEQDSAAAARMDSTTWAHARTLSRLRQDIAHVNTQIEALGWELERHLMRPAPRWGNSTPNRQGDIEQLRAALRAMRAMLSALHAQVAAIQHRHSAARALYGRQQDARYSLKVRRGLQEFAPSELTAPFVPAPRYGGVRNFLRFPGLPQGSKASQPPPP